MSLSSFDVIEAWLSAHLKAIEAWIARLDNDQWAFIATGIVVAAVIALSVRASSAERRRIAELERQQQQDWIEEDADAEEERLRRNARARERRRAKKEAEAKARADRELPKVVDLHAQRAILVVEAGDIQSDVKETANDDTSTE